MNRRSFLALTCAAFATPALSLTNPRGLVTPYSGDLQTGDIEISNRDRVLYLIQDGGTALLYPVAVPLEDEQWQNTLTVTRKAEWPRWTPTENMIRNNPDLEQFRNGVEGGEHNPMGARAIYLGNTYYRIHGTNAPEAIGLSASAGCIRMHNDDVIEVYDRVDIGARVRVIGTV